MVAKYFLAALCSFGFSIQLTANQLSPQSPTGSLSMKNHIPQVSSKQLNDLLFFGTSQATHYHAPSIIAFKSGNNMASCNRVIITKNTNASELQAVHNFYAGNKYAFWIDPADDDAKSKIEQQGFSYYGPFQAMKLEISNLKLKPIDAKITVRPVTGDEELFSSWAEIVVRSYAPDLQGDEQKNYLEQFKIFIQYLKQVHAPGDITFYLGLWDNVPVATGMFIKCSDFVAIHRIGTLPEFRNRGIGYAVTSLPLEDFKKQGIGQALLLASPSGCPLYEKIGFEYLATYAIYT